MNEQDFLDLTEKLWKFNITIQEEIIYEYTTPNLEISDNNRPPIEYNPKSLAPRGHFTTEYEYYINNLNRIFILFLELVPNREDDSIKYYNMNTQPKCEAILILLMNVFETYLKDKFNSLTRELKQGFGQTGINFQDNEDIVSAFKSISINLLKYDDKSESEPKREDKIDWEKMFDYLWDNIFNKSSGYMNVRHSIIHYFGGGLDRYGELRIIDKEFIKNCILIIAEIIYKIEERINFKHEKFIKYNSWQSTTINFKKN